MRASLHTDIPTDRRTDAHRSAQGERCPRTEHRQTDGITYVSTYTHSDWHADAPTKVDAPQLSVVSERLAYKTTTTAGGIVLV